MGGHPSQEKTDLRRRFLAERGRRDAADVAADSRAVCARVVRTRWFRDARHIAAYVPLPGEIDPSLIVAAALRGHKAVYFPRVGQKGLEFLTAEPSALSPGAYGILEPNGGAPVPDGASTLFLVPGVAFDPQGTRLGRGGGHYDRALAAHPSAVRFGLAAERDVAPRLPHDKWDQAMDGVVTGQRVMWAAARPMQGD